ncbi:MAG: hypothetical protein ACNS60_16145 [Candidatus Cyclobacteriaceae bacterium M2_1C_046]
MFVTILTIIYLALALFILGRFLKEKSDQIDDWSNNFKYKFKRVFVKNTVKKERRNDFSPSESSDEMEERKLQPEYRRIWD